MHKRLTVPTDRVPSGIRLRGAGMRVFKREKMNEFNVCGIEKGRELTFQKIEAVKRKDTKQLKMGNEYIFRMFCANTRFHHH